MAFNPEKPFQPNRSMGMSAYYLSEEYYMPTRDYHITPNLVSLRTQASVIFQKYAATNARDPVIPYLAMTYFDHYVSAQGVPNIRVIAMGDNEENNYRIQLFLTCCFIIAWKMRKPRFWLPDFLIRYDLPYLIEEIENLEQLIDSWLLQHRDFKDINGIADHNFKHPVTAFCFKDYLIDQYTFISEDIQNCLKVFATHKLYALQYDMRYTRFKPSIVAAAAIAFCVDKYYENETEDLLDAYMTIGGFNNDNLKLAIEMTVPGLTVYLFSDDDDDVNLQSSPAEDRVRFLREEKQQKTAGNRIDIEMLPPPNRIPPRG